MIIFLDMDSVLCSFVQGTCNVHHLDYPKVFAAWPKGEYRLDYGLRMLNAEIWSPIEKAGPSFWADLLPTPWCEQLLDLAQYADAYYIATVPWNADSAKGKIRWMHKHIDPEFNRYFLCGHGKGLLGRPGAMLIDDSEKHCQDFAAQGGTALLLPRPWNYGAGTPEDTIQNAKEILQSETLNG